MNILKKSLLPLLALCLVFGTQSCKKDEEMDPVETPMPNNRSASYMYEFNNGQVVPAAAYDGNHPDNFMAELTVTELSSTMVEISLELMNTLDGETYHVHAHDAADPATTPNGTPYNESPNGDVFIQMIQGNGGTAEASQTVSLSFDDIVTDYEGFFVVHDPLQAVNTADISTYIVVGSFARDQGDSGLMRSTFNYDFNGGQLVPEFAYDGMHDATLNASLTLQELANGSTRLGVMLDNTLNGETYHTHAHDMADPATTPNGTPYNESPNGDVLAFMIQGNGGTAFNSQMSMSSYQELTDSYEAFLVVHDPLQAINTADPTSYVILGVFAQ